jgi:hypothetical protein
MLATAERPVVVSQRLTFVATDADGIGGRQGQIRVGPVRFDVDGQPHEAAFHSSDTRISIHMSYDDRAEGGAAVVAYPVTVRWTLEVRIMALGDEPLPDDADFELVATPTPTDP